MNVVKKYLRSVGSITLANLFTLGFLIFLIAWIFMRQAFDRSTLDIHLHDTYFVIARSHVAAFFAALFLVFSLVYAIYPRITGRCMNRPLAYVHFGATLLAGFVLCLPLILNYEGLAGMPRRYLDYRDWSTFNTYLQLNAFQNWSIILFVCTQLVFPINLIYSSLKKAKVGDD